MKPSLRGSFARAMLAILAITVTAQPVIASASASVKGSSSTANSIYVKSAPNSQVTFKVDLNDKYRRQTAVFRVTRILSSKPSNIFLGSVKLDNYGIGSITKKFKVVKNDIFQVLIANKVIAQAKLPLIFKSSFTLLKLYVASVSPAVALPFVSPTPSAEPKSEPTPSASPAPTPSSTPAAIPTPTASPTPTPTPTPTPSVTPTQSAAPVSPPSGGGGGGGAPAPASDAKIDIAAILGVSAPVAGDIPVTTVTSTAEYTGTVTWSGLPSTFANYTVYTATITLTPKSGWTTTGVPADFFTVEHASATNVADSGSITAVFLRTAPAPINLMAIDGVTPPVAGATPVDTVTATEQFTGTVSWSPTVSSFAHGATYTATITLMPKTGFTLTGIAPDAFTVAGATSVHNSANSGVVTAVFPATSLLIVSNVAIGGVTAPVAGATPVSTITETPEYTGTVAWSPSASPTFNYSQIYTATITLTAKSGYTFSGVVADTFTVAGATTVHNLVNTGVITAIFPATGDPTPVTHTSIINVVPVAGIAPVTSINDDQYTGSILWTSAGGSVGTYFDTTTVYTATIQLTAKSGNTFAGVATDFSIGGSTSSTTTYGTETATVTAAFPATLDLVHLATPTPTASSSVVGVTFTSDPNSASYTARIYAHTSGTLLATVANYLSGADLLTSPEALAAQAAIALALSTDHEVEVSLTAVAVPGSGYQDSLESTKAHVSQPS